MMIKNSFSILTILSVFLLTNQGIAQEGTFESRGRATPTVFVLLDSSASMERMPDSEELPLCATWNGQHLTPPFPYTSMDHWLANAPPTSRQGLAAEVLGGTIPNYYCVMDFRNFEPSGMSRLSFRDDDLDVIDGTPSQGWPHINICSRGSSFNPETDCDPLNVFIRQANNGILDGENGQELNFIFSAYDSFSNPERAVSGLWSYGDEVAEDLSNQNNQGLRNILAPNGRLIQPFLPEYGVDDLIGRATVNERIQREILNSVPYSGTPLGAAFEDISWFYNNDYSVNELEDPVDSGIGDYGATTQIAGVCADSGNSCYSGTDCPSDDFCNFPGRCASSETYCYSDADCGGTGCEFGVTVVGMDPYADCRPRNLLLVTDGIDTYEACRRLTCSDRPAICDTGVCDSATGYCQCENNDDCRGMPCVGSIGQCTISMGTCSSNADCLGGNDYCAFTNGVCLPPGCEENVYLDPVERARRLHDEDDIEVYVIGYGVSGVCKRACSTNMDCGSLGECVNNQCELIFCSSDLECESGSDGCIDNFCTNAFCVVDDECDAGSVCEMHSIVDEIACAGSGGDDDCRSAYIVDGDPASLARRFQMILNNIIGQPVSRVGFVETTQTTEYRSGGEQGYYRIQPISMISGDIPYWSGDLLTQEYRCDGGELELIDPDGDGDYTQHYTRDIFDDDDWDFREREVLTNAQNVHSCATGAEVSLFKNTQLLTSQIPLQWSQHDSRLSCCRGEHEPDWCFNNDISPEVECHDPGTSNVGTNATMPDWIPNDGPSAPSDSCMQELDVNTHVNLFGALGHDAEAVNAFDCSNLNHCPNHMQQRCVDGRCVLREHYLEERMIRWIMGQRIKDMPEHLIGGLIPEFSRDSIMPAMLHSEPAVVGGVYRPLNLTGHENFRFQSITEVDAFDNGVSRNIVQERYTMAYTLGHDGMIHAFNVENGEEEWAFLPNSIAHLMQPSLVRGHQSIIDGSPIVRNMPVHRTISGNGPSTKWMTVLITGFRGGGRGYVALDVTDPIRPRFLWELDAEVDPAIGLTYGTPAMGTVRLDDCSDADHNAGNGTCFRGVAILGAGADLDGLGVVDLTFVGRALYVVDIQTGHVIRRFERLGDDAMNGDWIDAPITGSVVAMDESPGSLITRAYVGDTVGRLLRLDTSSGDPLDWQLDVFYDPRTDFGECNCGDDPAECYDRSLACESGSNLVEDGAYPGERACGGFESDGNGGVSNGDPFVRAECALGPLTFAPSVATHAATGNTIIVYGFGDVDNLENQSTRTNMVISLTDDLRFQNTGEIITDESTVSLNWMLELQEGEKVTTEPFIFEDVAYFATFAPNLEDLCEGGSSRIYGLDFIGGKLGARRAIDDQEAFFSGAETNSPIEGRLPVNTTGEFGTQGHVDINDDGVIDYYRFYDRAPGAEDLEDGEEVVPVANHTLNAGTIFGLGVIIPPTCEHEGIPRVAIGGGSESQSGGTPTDPSASATGEQRPVLAAQGTGNQSLGRQEFDISDPSRQAGPSGGYNQTRTFSWGVVIP